MGPLEGTWAWLDRPTFLQRFPLPPSWSEAQSGGTKDTLGKTASESEAIQAKETKPERTWPVRAKQSKETLPEGTQPARAMQRYRPRKQHEPLSLRVVQGVLGHLEPFDRVWLRADGDEDSSFRVSEDIEGGSPNLGWCFPCQRQSSIGGGFLGGPGRGERDLGIFSCGWGKTLRGGVCTSMLSNPGRGLESTGVKGASQSQRASEWKTS